MRMPARDIRGHLVLTYDGPVYAIWRVSGPTYDGLDADERLAWHSRQTAALMSLPGSYSIHGVCRPIDAATVARQVVDGVDLAHCRTWEKVARYRYAEMRERRMWERERYLCVGLPQSHSASRRAALAGGWARFSRIMGLMSVPPSEAEVRRHQRVAEEVGSRLARRLGPEFVRAAEEDEVRWLYARSALRGTTLEPTREELTAPRPREGSRPSLASLRVPWLWEGGAPDDEDRPDHRGYVRARVERGQSYQALLTFAALPARWAVPGGEGEMFHRLGELDYPVDWCLRTEPSTNAKSQADVRAQKRKLSGQDKEWASDRAGQPVTLPMAMEDLDTELARLAAAPGAGEQNATFLFAIGSGDLRSIESHAEDLRAFTGAASEYDMPRPPGSQRACWHAMLPGAPASPVCKDYRQAVLAEDVAGQAPFTGSGLGDPRGAVFAYQLGTAGGPPVLFDMAYGPRAPDAVGGPFSASVGFCGKVRSGKSWGAKTVVWNLLATGASAIAVDCTEMREWGNRLIPHLPPECSARDIRLAEQGAGAVDPARMFKGPDAPRFTTGFLSLLVAAGPTDMSTIVIGEATERVITDGGGLLDILDALEIMGTSDPIARDVARKLSVFSRQGLAQVAFGRGAPLRLTEDYIVFSCPELKLPTEHELSNAVLAARISVDQTLSLGLLYLVTAVARVAAFRDRDRFTAVVTDEAWGLTRSPQGEDLLVDVGKHGPKASAGLVLATHLPSEIPKSVNDFLGTRFLYRMAPKHAPEGLEWLDMEPTPQAVDMISEQNRHPGECLMYDRWARRGLVEVVRPHDPGLDAAMNTAVGVRAPAPAPVRHTRRARARATR